MKTLGFKNPKYIGDPINAVRIFNEKEADELMVFDIDATVNGVEPDFVLIAKLAAECRMPLCYGGGVATAEQAVRLIDLGVEKVAVSAAAIANPALLTEMAAAVGRQSVVAVLDVRRRGGLFASAYDVYTHNGRIKQKADMYVLATRLQEAGAGEIVINSIDRDGMMQGYDLDMALEVKKILKVPVTFLGGAGCSEHMVQLIEKIGLTGAAAGSLFVFKGKYRAVLISYMTIDERKELFGSLFDFRNVVGDL